MSELPLTNTLTPGTNEDVADVQENFQDVLDWANGNIDGDNFTAATNQALGLNETGTVRRGKSIISTEETTTSASYTLLTTPDRVSNVVLPTDGLIAIAFQGMWKETNNNTARAAIFIGATQMKGSLANTAAPNVLEAAINSTVNNYASIGSFGGGLTTATNTTAYTGDVTTGQVVGVNALTVAGTQGVCYVFAAAGTYTVSVQYKTSAGTASVKNRKLWVWTQAFG